MMRRLYVLLIWGSLGFLTPGAIGLNWVYTTVDPAANAGSRSRIAVNSEGNPCIGYYDAAIQKPRYAYKDSQGWHTTIVGNDDHVGQYCSLAVGGDDVVHISYYDAFHKDLKYAFKSGTSWTIETPDGTESADTGTCTSIAVNGQHRPAIAYYNVTDRSLQLAIKEAETWGTELADGPEINIGSCVSAAFDASGNLGISYYDAGAGRLKFAYRTAGGLWNVETVDSAKQVGRFNSVGFDGKGRAFIGYYDEANKRLKLAAKSNSGWNIEVIDQASGVDVGRNVDLVVDRNGNPQICYLDLTNTTLKFAYKDGSGWHKEAVRSCGVLEDAFSLALDRSGRPHISFCGADTNSLDYVTVPDTRPWAIEDAITTDEDVAVDIPVLDNDTDTEGDPLSVKSVTQGQYGSVTINANGTVRYTPAADFNGFDTFHYTATDGILTSSGLVTVTVNPINDPPKISITSPNGAGWFAPDGDITFTVTATDIDSDIQKVEFYRGDTLLGTSTVSPFDFTWSKVPAGAYAVTAKAYDVQGASKTSDPVQIIVGDVSGGKVTPTPSGGCATMGLLLLSGVIGCLMRYGRGEL